MQITVNGKIQDFEQNAPLSTLIQELCKNPEHVIAELNEQIIIKDQWGATQINDGDSLELVHFVGGG
jgi:thiamine biosynthesis protein ThiS